MFSNFEKSFHSAILVVVAQSVLCGEMRMIGIKVLHTV